MDVILNITAPIFLLIIIGFVGVKYGVMSKDALPFLSKFVLYFALPAVMITKISAMDLREVLNVSYMSAYAVGGLTAFAVMVALARYVMHESWNTSSVAGIGALMPNSAFIGFPVLLQFLDSSAAQAFAMVLMVENIIFLPIALMFTEAVASGQKSIGKAMLKKVAKRIITHPIIISVLMGVLLSMLGLHLSNFIGESLELLALSAAPTALFVIGGSLVGISIRGDRALIGVTASLKLMLFPLVTFVCLALFPAMPSDLRIAAIVFAAMPMFSMYPIIGAEYGQRSFCASSLLVTTVLSFGTISVLLKFLV